MNFEHFERRHGECIDDGTMRRFADGAVAERNAFGWRCREPPSDPQLLLPLVRRFRELHLARAVEVLSVCDAVLRKEPNARFVEWPWDVIDEPPGAWKWRDMPSAKAAEALQKACRVRQAALDAVERELRELQQ